MAAVARPRFVDVGNPALSISCPRCGLRTARFMEFCASCGYALWPSVQAASRAFQIWRDHDPAREPARPFDVDLPGEAGLPPVVDFEARAHELGIHVFPSSVWPFPICAGMFFLFLALVPFSIAGLRIAFGVLGAIIFLTGVVGWVVVEDSRIFPSSGPDSGQAHH